MDQDAKKRIAALAALEFLQPGIIVGVGTGSTVNYFIDALADWRGRIEGAVSSYKASTARLDSLGIPVLDPNNTGDIPLYVDGADEATRHLHLIKGGGGALTREKIVASGSRKFICITDDSKIVDVLGDFPLPVEVLPMARSLVGRALAKLGGRPELRAGFTTDNGNVILDVHGLRIVEPVKMETEINQLPGVVSNGIFAQRRADILLIGGEQGVETLR